MQGKREKGGLAARIAAAGAMLILIGAGYVFFELTRKSQFSPKQTRLEKDPETGKVLYEVSRNIPLAQLAADLRAHGLIPGARAFKWYLRLTRQDKRIRAGFYFLPPRNSVLEIAAILTSGRMATRTLTIPEGKATWEIYEILRGHYPLDSLRFDSLVHSVDFCRNLGLETEALEGYLFPDTYVLPWEMTEAEILEVLYRRFEVVIGELDTSSSPVMKYGMHGWITLASIVEKEAAVRSEQRLIAGVFLNRLERGWTLGADPTVRFALRKLTGPLRASELKIKSPYNTRRFAGLPPGPICSPGKEALEATLHPMETDKMYFVAKDDGSREHFFSDHQRQHDRYKARAAVNRRKRGLR